MIFSVENGYGIRGIAPPDLRDHPEFAPTYWQWVAAIGLKVKDRELSQGLDKDGKPLRRISEYTRKHRKSAMTPSGKGDPSAPPLMPGRALSRTRSLLTARAYPDRAEFWWRFDAWTGDSWARVLDIQAGYGRDVFGLSPKGQQQIQAQAAVLWERFKKGQSIPVMPLPAVAVGGGVSTSARPRGGMTISEIEAHFRAPAKPIAEREANVLLRHVFGEPTEPGKVAGGAVVPRPPKPKPIVVQRAAIKPKPKPKPEPPKPKPEPPKPKPEPAYTLSTHGNLSESDIAEMRAEVEALPEPVLRALRKAGIPFAYAEKLADFDPVLATQTPRGWAANMTWEFSDGAFYVQKVILVCKTRKDYGGAQVVSTRRFGVLRHETGHAMGLQGMPAGRQAFDKEWKDAYATDAASLPDAERPAYTYYLQSGDAGPDEAFAETFAQLHGSGAAPRSILTAFPRCAALLRQWLKDLS